MSQVNKTSFSQTLSEMTGNLSLAIMRKADVNKNGYIELMELQRMSVDDPISYMLLEDLYNFAPDFMDKHRSVITGASVGANNRNSTGSIQGSGSMVAQRVAGSGGSALRKSMQNDLSNMQSQA